MFIINKNGHYFEIDSNLHIDSKAFYGCQFFETEQEMLKEVCKQQDLEMDEVEGSTLYVTEQKGAIFVINDRCDKEEVEGAVETFLSEYEL
jgi:hypothetical protein